MGLGDEVKQISEKRAKGDKTNQSREKRSEVEVTETNYEAAMESIQLFLRNYTQYLYSL